MVTIIILAYKVVMKAQINIKYNTYKIALSNINTTYILVIICLEMERTLGTIAYRKQREAKGQ